MNIKKSAYRVMIIAGEASGDLHGANLVRALKKKMDSVSIFGIGGQMLKDAGVEIFLDASQVSVVGISEVLSKFSGILKGFRAARNLLSRQKPDLLILIDFPDFNLRVAGMAKEYGIPVFYYISPQIWAWRSGRVRKIKRLVDHMAVILPFEASFYRKNKVPVTYVGHPILDAKPGYTLPDTESHHTDLNHPVIGLLPGSREGEVARHLPIMLRAADILSRQFENISFIVSKASSIHESLIQSVMKDCSGSADVTVDSGGAFSVFQKITLAIAVSGTVTLEAAIFGVPEIVIYKVSDLSYRIGKSMIQVEHICLANLIAGKTVVPELIQHDASPEKIAQTASAILNHPSEQNRMKEELIKIRSILGGPGASDRAAEIVKSMLYER